MPGVYPGHDDGEDDIENGFSDTSSSVESLEYEEEQRRRRKRSKKSRRDESDGRKHRHHSSSKSDKKKKRHKKSSKKKGKKDGKRHKSKDGDSSDEGQSDDDNDNSYSHRRRQKRSRKERKRRRKERTNDDRNSNKKEFRSLSKDSSSNNGSLSGSRGPKISDALHHLLSDKPDFASELPLLLIRMAGGTTFDLRQVTDQSIAKGLQAVFEALEDFGVKKQQTSGMWMFQNPASATRRDELVLLKLVRSFLDEVGLTMEEIRDYDAKQSERQKQEEKEIGTGATTIQEEERQRMKELTHNLLKEFRSKDATLGTQLANLCMTIVEGESVSVDGIQDECLKSALESLFQACGLEKSEIEDEEEENDDESNESILMGYGLPSDVDTCTDTIHMKLALIMAACREGPPKRKSIGPMRRPTTKEEEDTAAAVYGTKNAEKSSDDSEDDGPLLPGEARNTRGPELSLDTIKAQAEYRELELKSTSAGIPMPNQNGGREEWMINPGQHDFLSGIKSGQAIKSRGFQNKKSKDSKNPPPIHPAVQAEMDAIMQAHENARGPSLMDLHRSKQSEQKQLASSSAKGKKQWKWNREKDLDAGRRVDKDALGMILGGAAENLKTKFAGGFNR